MSLTPVHDVWECEGNAILSPNETHWPAQRDDHEAGINLETDDRLAMTVGFDCGLRRPHRDYRTSAVPNVRAGRWMVRTSTGNAGARSVLQATTTTVRGSC